MRCGDSGASSSCSRLPSSAGVTSFASVSSPSSRLVAQGIAQQRGRGAIRQRRVSSASSATRDGSGYSGSSADTSVQRPASAAWSIARLPSPSATSAIDAQFQQAPHQRRRRRFGAAGQHQRVAAVGCRCADIGSERGASALERGEMAAARGFQQRRAAVIVARMRVGARREQDGDDVGVAGERRLVQRAAAARVARIDLGLVLEQQLHAGGIVLVAAGRGEQRRLAADGFRLRAAFEQEARQAPVAGGAGDAERVTPSRLSASSSAAASRSSAATPGSELRAA